MLVVHIHAIHDLAVPVFDSSSEVIIYTTFNIGSIKKATEQKVYSLKNDTSVVFNEVKYFPIVVYICFPFPSVHIFLLFVTHILITFATILIYIFSAFFLFLFEVL